MVVHIIVAQTAIVQQNRDSRLALQHSELLYEQRASDRETRWTLLSQSLPVTLCTSQSTSGQAQRATTPICLLSFTSLAHTKTQPPSPLDNAALGLYGVRLYFIFTGVRFDTKLSFSMLCGQSTKFLLLMLFEREQFRCREEILQKFGERTFRQLPMVCWFGCFYPVGLAFGGRVFPLAGFGCSGSCLCVGCSRRSRS